ncbi:MAG: hypothetical protein ACYCZU_14390, partial [Devosia sp.]
AQAASSYPAKCLILPLLQADCRAAISDTIDHAGDATATVASAGASAAKEAAVAWPVPVWWDCEPAPAGSGHLYDC